jgi:hypothetical protein
MTVKTIEINKAKKPVWIAGIARGHNAGVCLLKDGEIDSLQYQRITAILVEAVKELNERLKKLEGN